MISQFFMWFGFWMWIPTEEFGVTFQKKFLLSLAFTISTTNTYDLFISISDIFLHLIFGFLVAFPISICIDSLSMTGEIFDTIRGQSLDVTYAPMEARSLHTISKILSGYALCAAFEYGTIYKAIGFLNSIDLSKSVSVDYIPHILFFVMFRAIVMGVTFIAPYFAFVIIIELIFSTLVKILPHSSFQSESFVIKMIVGFLLLGGVVGTNHTPMELMNDALEWLKLYV